MLDAQGWAVGRWYAYTPAFYADVDARSAGLALGRRWVVVEQSTWASRIGLAWLHVILAVVLLFALADPALGQQERAGTWPGSTQAAPSAGDFSIVLPPTFIETRPGALGAALPGEVALGVWRKTASPLTVVIRAVPLPSVTTLAQYVEMKRAARRSLPDYTETFRSPTQLSGQPALDLAFTYRNPAGQVTQQRDILVVFGSVGWAISWVHPETLTEWAVGEGEAAVSSFRFQGTTDARRPPEPAPAAAPQPAAPLTEAPWPAPAPVAFTPPDFAPLLAERGTPLLRDQRMLRLAAGQASARYTVLVPPQTARLAVVASWPGSVVELALYRPDGDLAVLRRGSEPPLVLTVEDPMPGQWAYAVTAVDVPSADYPVALAAAVAPAAPAAAPARPQQTPAAVVPPGLPRAGQPLPAQWLAFLGVVAAESGLWLRRRLSPASVYDDDALPDGPLA
ncbi:MAG: DcrB-related protein [Chloroflexi bacterium]|nr:DcrB-related protein [Chloroflexota bacterium]